jgi:predicted deacetylase
VVDGGRLTEEDAVGDGALPGDVVGGSSLNVLLHLQRKTVVRFTGSKGNGGGRWWCSTVSRAASASAEAGRRARGRVSVRLENGGGFSTARPRANDKAGQGTWSGD